MVGMDEVIDRKIEAIFSGFASKWVDVTNVPIHYLEGGSGDTLVLVHGWSNNGRGWWPLVEELKHMYHLVLVDMPGFGDSGDLEEYSIEIQADYLAQFVKGLSLSPLSMVGLSMGSQVLGQFASVYSELTASMILFGSVFHRGRRRRMAHKSVQLFLKGVSRGKRRSKVFKRIMDDERFAKLTSKYINMYRLNMELVKANNLARKKTRVESWIQMGISEASFSLEQALKGVSIPVLLVFGDHDKITTVKEAQAMMQGGSGQVAFAVMPQAGHVAPMEQPTAAVEVMEDFLKGIKQTKGANGGE